MQPEKKHAETAVCELLAHLPDVPEIIALKVFKEKLEYLGNTRSMMIDVDGDVCQCLKVFVDNESLF